MKEIQVWLKEKCHLDYTIDNLKSLKYLYLNNNKLTSIPDSISKMKSLKYLYLSNNNLTSIPDSISNLKSLKTLYLENNSIIINEDNKKLIKFLEKFDQRWIEYTLVENTKLNDIIFG